MLTLYNQIIINNYHQSKKNFRLIKCIIGGDNRERRKKPKKITLK